MPKLDQIAVDAALLAEFAAAVVKAADAPASSAIVRNWLSRAELLHRWTTIRPLLALPEANLASQTQRLIQLSRENQPGRISRLTGWFSRTADRNDQSAHETITLLEQLAAQVDLEQRHDLGARLHDIISTWQTKGSPPARLAELQAHLAVNDGEVAEELLARLHAAHESLPSSVQDHETFTEEAKPAIVLVHQFLTVLGTFTIKTPDWEFITSWISDWLAAFGISAQIELVPLPHRKLEADRSIQIFPVANYTRSLLLHITPATTSTTKTETLITTENPWSVLPLPPEWGEASAPWLSEAQRGGKRLAATRKRFIEWLASSTGQFWFHKCLETAASEHESAAAAWWQTLRRANWCVSFPDLDPDNGWIHNWPHDTPFNWPAVESIACEQMRDQILEVQKYAPTADDARIVISDGVPKADSALARFHTLYQIVGRDVSWWSGGRWAEARNASFAPSQHHSCAERLCLIWLDALADATRDDPKLLTLRAWADAFALTVLPVASAAAPLTGHDVQSVFSDQIAGEIVRIARYGLCEHNRMIRTADIVVSLGPAPTGLLELEECAHALPAQNPLCTQVHKLREAITGDYLSEAAIELYVNFWSDVGATAKEIAPTAYAIFAERLTRFLQGAFGFTSFHPTSIRDYPEDWLVVAPGGRAMTGFIRRVFRPGLQDEYGNLRIPAVVEVE